MTRPFLGALALSGLASVAGCGPIEYVGRSSREAAAALASARAGQAEQFAPYEFTKAVAIEQKARELAGQGRFEVAIAYDRQATELANKASALARSRVRRGQTAPARGDAE